MDKQKIALLSVSDKQGVVDFGKVLVNKGFTLLSTGGTADILKKNNVAVKDVSDHTGFPEIMAGRVKTLHPKIHGGILGRRGTDDSTMASHQIEPIDLVVVNLYPFEQTIARSGCQYEEAIEQIDIGGPAMVRAAAKNHKHVSILVDPGDYDLYLNELSEKLETSQAFRNKMAAKAFAHTAAYDSAISAYLNPETELPEQIQLKFERKQSMRYGENPHQKAAFYIEKNSPSGTIASANSKQGKPLSFNNIADADAAVQAVQSFNAPACVIVKHANPCGVAIADDLNQAYDQAFLTDPTSAFGGIIAFNGLVDDVLANEIINRQFVEVLVAPDFSEQALTVLKQKPNIRVLQLGETNPNTMPTWDYKRVQSGLLVQESDLEQLASPVFKVVSQRQPDEQELSDLKFAWKVVKYVKSNAIVFSKNGRTIGIGAGQMSRVISAKIAVIKAEDAQLEVQGSVMASDAFFPFRDGIDAAAEAGIKAVIQPGGSIRDEEIIAAANEHDMTMIFTGIRHFRH